MSTKLKEIMMERNVKNLITDLHAKTDELNRLLRDITQDMTAQARVLELEAENKNLMDGMAAIRAENQNLTNRIQTESTLLKKADDMEQRIRALTSDNKGLERALGRERANSVRLEDELKRSKRDVQVIETKTMTERFTGADTVTEIDVMRLVEDLNDKIFQVAASMAKEGVPRWNWARSTECKEEYDALVPLIGEKATWLLQNAHAGEHRASDVLQIMLQSIMVAWAAVIVPSWNFDILDIQDYLKAVYEKIREEGRLLTSFNNCQADCYFHYSRGPSHRRTMACTYTDTDV